MILTTIFNFFANIWIELFNLLPTLPNFPESLNNVINTFLDLIFQSGELILFFMPPFWLLEILITLSLVMEAFVIGYYVFMWVLNKIPIINIR